jgi:hypothetical protein
VDAKTLLPVINEAEEINSIIDLINIAKEAVNAPVYLLMGNDSGVLANKVLRISNRYAFVRDVIPAHPV